jgi:hypothetical protein
MKYTSMKPLPTLGGFCCILLVGLLTGCGHKPAPLKEGVILSVRWVESSTPTSTVTDGLYRTDKINPQLGGSYGQDIYGVLYPTCLEVRFVGSKDSHAQIIPLSQIVWLEFGDGGIVLDKH